MGNNIEESILDLNFYSKKSAILCLRENSKYQMHA